MLGLLLLQLTAAFAAIDHSKGHADEAMQPAHHIRATSIAGYTKYGGIQTKKGLDKAASTSCTYNVCPTKTCAAKQNVDRSFTELCQKIETGRMPGEIVQGDLGFTIDDAAAACTDEPTCKAFYVDRHKGFYFSTWVDAKAEDEMSDAESCVGDDGDDSACYPDKFETADDKKMYFTFVKQ